MMHDEATIWWVWIEVSSWPDAVKRLKSLYGIPHLAYKTYSNIFAVEKNEELADIFCTLGYAVLTEARRFHPDSQGEL